MLYVSVLGTCAFFFCQLIAPKDCAEQEFQVARYTIMSANKFFRMLRKHGVLICEPARTEAMECSRSMCETRSRSFVNEWSCITVACFLTSLNGRCIWGGVRLPSCFRSKKEMATIPSETKIAHVNAYNTFNGIWGSMPKSFTPFGRSTLEC